MQFPLFTLKDHLISASKAYRSIYGRHLPIFGEIAEVIVEEEHGVKRYAPNTPDADGTLINAKGADHVQIKAITPEKLRKEVQIKPAGKWAILYAVKFDENLEYEVRTFNKSDLKEREDISESEATVSWSQMKKTEQDAAANP